MAFIRQPQPSDLPLHPPNARFLYLYYLSSTGSSLIALSSKMADESIYYILSRCVLCLRESKSRKILSIICSLTHRLTELQQQDRLFDSQVYLDVLNRTEVRTVVQHNTQPCFSAILLLASLLRVSFRLRFSRTYNTSNFPSHMSTSIPFSFGPTPLSVCACSIRSISRYASSRRPLETCTASTSSSHSQSSQGQYLACNSLSSSSILRQTFGLLQPA